MLAGQLIQCAKGLVHELDAGRVREQASEGSSLLHAAGQLPGISAAELLESYHSDHFERTALGICADLTENAKGQHDVPQHGAPGQKRRILQENADVPSTCLRWPLCESHFSLVRSYQAGYYLEKCGLAASAGSSNGDKLTAIDNAAYVTEDVYPSGSQRKALPQVGRNYVRYRRSRSITAGLTGRMSMMIK